LKANNLLMKIMFHWNKNTIICQ